MTAVDLDFPEAIFIKRLDGRGYGFFYSTLAQFQNAADGFMRPIQLKIDEESRHAQDSLPVNAEQVRLKAAISSMQKVFAPDWEFEAAIDAARCVAASCAREINWDDDQIPTCIVIEEVGDEMIVREGIEFLEHPGYPLSVVVGSKADGGGVADFFDSFEEFKRIASKPPTDARWLPQLIYRLYVKTPSIMTGHPTPGDKGVGVQCHALTLNRKGQLIERNPA